MGIAPSFWNNILQITRLEELNEMEAIKRVFIAFNYLFTPLWILFWLGGSGVDLEPVSSLKGALDHLTFLAIIVAPPLVFHRLIDYLFDGFR
jgi:hypothetical protein